jgi:hypothetical protein
MQTGTAESRQEQFERDGFVTVTGVLSPEEVAELREFFTRLFSTEPEYAGDNRFARYDIFSRYPETRALLTKPPVLDALRDLLGDDFALVPESGVQDSRYGWWHKDTSEMERDGVSFHKDPDFRMVQCAVYLQENDEHGGGLDILPGSHLLEDDTAPPRKHSLWQRVLFKLGLSDPGRLKPPQPEGAYSIPSRAGDMVIFDVRANHMASQPTGRIEDIPAHKRKFGLFFISSANNAHPRSYRAYVADKEHYDYLQGGAHTYPPDVEALASEHGFTLI